MHVFILKFSFFVFFFLLGYGEIVSVLYWRKNVGNDCKDVDNNKDGWIAGAVCAPNASGFRVQM